MSSTPFEQAWQEFEVEVARGNFPSEPTEVEHPCRDEWVRPALASLAQHIRSGIALWSAQPWQNDALLEHCVAVTRMAPFLLLLPAASPMLVAPNDPRHVLLRDAWDVGVSHFPNSGHAHRNATQFYLRWDEDSAGLMCQRMLQLAPGDDSTHRAASEYQFQGADLGWPGCSYERALAHLEQAWSTTIMRGVFSGRGRMAMAMLVTGRHHEARVIAEELLQEERRSDEDRQLAETVLGLLEQDTRLACDHLKRSGEVESWQNWGPSLRLARRLAGTCTNEVRAFLRQVCLLPARRPKRQAEMWLNAFEEGKFECLVNPGR